MLDMKWIKPYVAAIQAASEKVKAGHWETAYNWWMIGIRFNEIYGIPDGPGRGNGMPVSDQQEYADVIGLQYKEGKGVTSIQQARNAAAKIKDESQLRDLTEEYGNWYSVTQYWARGKTPNAANKRRDSRNDGTSGIQVTLPADFSRELLKAGYSKREIQRTALAYFNYPEPRDDIRGMLKSGEANA
jgi:hypothetical protein